MIISIFSIPVFSDWPADFIGEKGYNYSCKNHILLNETDGKLEFYSEGYKPYLVENIPFIVNLSITVSNNLSELSNNSDLEFRFILVCGNDTIYNWTGRTYYEILDDNHIVFSQPFGSFHTNGDACILSGKIYTRNETLMCSFGEVEGTRDYYDITQRVWNEDKLLFKIQTDLLKKQTEIAEKQVDIDNWQLWIAVLTGLFIAINTGVFYFYYKQNKLFKQQNQIMEKQYELDKETSEKRRKK